MRSRRSGKVAELVAHLEAVRDGNTNTQFICTPPGACPCARAPNECGCTPLIHVGGTHACATCKGPQWTGESRLWRPHLAMPMELRKPSRIFVADMGDLFYEEVTDEEIAIVFTVMMLSQHHTFQVLTKRAARMRKWITEWNESRCLDVGAVEPAVPFCSPEYSRHVLAMCEKLGRDPHDATWPPKHVHLGVSVENQKYADARIPELLATPASTRFVSYEPALGPVDFSAFLPPQGPSASGRPDHARLHWIICGGESGPGSRDFDVAWGRSVRDQCKAADVAFFYKQSGSRSYDSSGPDMEIAAGAIRPRLVSLKKKGGLLEDIPKDLHVRQFPEDRS